MSDLMLLGVLRMPLPQDCACLSNPLSQVAQFVARGRQAADVIEQQAAQIERLRAAPVFAFLLGESALDGVQFGGSHPIERGAYWWRRHLRAALAEGES